MPESEKENELCFTDQIVMKVKVCWNKDQNDNSECTINKQFSDWDIRFIKISVFIVVWSTG